MSSGLYDLMAGTTSKSKGSKSSGNTTSLYSLLGSGFPGNASSDLYDRPWEYKSKAGDRPDYISADWEDYSYDAESDAETPDLEMWRADLATQNDTLKSWNDYLKGLEQDYDFYSGLYQSNATKTNYGLLTDAKTAYQDAYAEYKSAVEKYNGLYDTYSAEYRRQNPEEAAAVDAYDWMLEKGMSDEEGNIDYGKATKDVLGGRADELYKQAESAKTAEDRDALRRQAVLMESLSYSSESGYDFAALRKQISSLDTQIAEMEGKADLAKQPTAIGANGAFAPSKEDVTAHMEKWSAENTEATEADRRQEERRYRREQSGINQAAALASAGAGQDISVLRDRRDALSDLLEYSLAAEEEQRLFGGLSSQTDYNNAVAEAKRQYDKALEDVNRAMDDWAGENIEVLKNDPSKASEQRKALELQYNVDGLKTDYNRLMQRRDDLRAEELVGSVPKEVSGLLQEAASALNSYTLGRYAGAQDGAVLAMIPELRKQIAEATGWGDTTLTDNILLAQRYYNAKRMQDRAKAEKSIATAHPFRASLKTNLRQITAGLMGAAELAGQRSLRESTGSEVSYDLSAPGLMTSRLNTETRKQVAQDIESGETTMTFGILPNKTNAANRTAVGKVFVKDYSGSNGLGSFMYNTVESAADSLVNMAIGTAGAAALGMPLGSEAAARFSGALINVVMGSNVMASEAVSAIESGEDPTKAILRAVVSGAIEGFTESQSAGEILTSLYHGSSVFGSLVKSAVSEGLEEWQANVMNRMADVYFNKEATVRTAARALQEQGYTEEEALRKAITDIMLEDAESTAAGFLSGLMISGLGMATNAGRYAASGGKKGFRDATVLAVSLDMAQSPRPTADAVTQYRWSNTNGSVTVTQVGENKYDAVLWDANGRMTTSKKGFTNTQTAIRAAAELAVDNLGGKEMIKADKWNHLVNQESGTTPRAKAAASAFYRGSTTELNAATVRGYTRNGIPVYYTQDTPTAKQIRQFTNTTESGARPIRLAESIALGKVVDAIFNGASEEELAAVMPNGKTDADTVAKFLQLYTNPGMRELIATLTGNDVSQLNEGNYAQVVAEAIRLGRANAKLTEAVNTAQTEQESARVAADTAFNAEAEANRQAAADLVESYSPDDLDNQALRQMLSEGHSRSTLKRILSTPALRSAFERIYGVELSSTTSEAVRQMRAALGDTGVETTEGATEDTTEEDEYIQLTDGSVMTREEFVESMVLNGFTEQEATEAFNAAVDAGDTGGTYGVHLEQSVDRSQLTDRQRASIKALGVLANKLGINIYMFQSQERTDEQGRVHRVGENGSYDPQTGTLRIDVAAGVDGRGVIMYTAAHELTHFIKQWSPDSFDKLSRFLEERYFEKGVLVSELVERQQQKYLRSREAELRAELGVEELTAEQRASITPMSYERAYEEMIADSLETMLADGRVVEQLRDLQRQDKTLVQKIVDFIRDLAGKIKSMYSGERPDSYEGRLVQEMSESLDELTELFRSGLESAAENRIDAVAETETEATQTAETEAANETKTETGTSQPVTAEEEYRLSRRLDPELMDDAEQKNQLVPKELMDQVRAQRQQVVDIYAKVDDQSLLPPDENPNPKGITAIKNGSYAISEEPSTICPRSLTMDILANEVAQIVGHPLSFEENMFIAQEAMNWTDTPECLYCYVAADRKLYTDALGRYLQQRDDAITAHQQGESDDWILQNILGRKVGNKKEDNKVIRNRIRFWLDAADSGAAMLNSEDLAGVLNDQESLRAKRDSLPAEKRAEFDLATRYAQSASHAKERIKYAAYMGDILNFSAVRVKKLNAMFGLRMYSYTDFSPAFILENMQMFTDAAVKGLKVLAYTKEPSFVEIFGGTGANISMSCFAMPTPDANGEYHQDGMQGMDWDKARELRDRFPGAGITMVCTTDEQVRWAMEQPWVDVVLPFHSVYGGGVKSALLFGWKNYRQMQEDQNIKGVKALAKQVLPPEHQNDIIKYMEGLDRIKRAPRFAQFLNGYEDYKAGTITADEFRELNPNYMKLVNETRRAAGDTPAVMPNFDIGSVQQLVDGMIARGGYVEQPGYSTEGARAIAEEIAEKGNEAGWRVTPREDALRRSDREDATYADTDTTEAEQPSVWQQWLQTPNGQTFRQRYDAMFGEGAADDIKGTLTAFQRAMNSLEAAQARNGVDTAKTDAPAILAAQQAAEDARDKRRTLDRVFGMGGQNPTNPDGSQQSLESTARQAMQSVVKQAQEQVKAARAEMRRQNEMLSGMHDTALTAERKAAERQKRELKREYESKLRAAQDAQIEADKAWRSELRTTKRDAKLHEEAAVRAEREKKNKEMHLYKFGQRIKERHERRFNSTAGQTAMEDTAVIRATEPRDATNADIDPTMAWSTVEEQTAEQKRRERFQKWKAVVSKLRAALINDTQYLSYFDSLQGSNGVGETVNPYMKLAAVSSATTERIFKDGLVSVNGDEIGPAFKDVILRWNADGTINQEETDTLRWGLLLAHTVDRMSFVKNAQEARIAFEQEHPRVLEYTPDMMALLVANRDEANDKAALKKRWEQFRLSDTYRNASADAQAEYRDDYDRQLLQIEDNYAYVREAKEYDKLIQRERKAQDKAVFADANGKPVSAETAQAALEELEKQNPWLPEARKDLYAWWETFMREWVVGTTMSESQYERMREMFPHYVPTYRINKNTHFDGLVHALTEKGSTEYLLYTEDAFANMISSMVKKYRTNAMKQNLRNTVLADDSGAYDGIVEVDPAELEDDDLGGDFENFTEEVDALSTVIGETGLVGDEVNGYKFVVWEDGKRKSIYTNKDMATAIHAVENYRSDSALEEGVRTLTGVVRKATDWQKRFITGYNPFFGVRNMARDFPTAVINSTSGIKFGRYWMQAAKEINADSDNWRVFQSLGGAGMGYYATESGRNGNTAAFQRQMKPAEGWRRGAEKVGEALGKFNEVTESITRFAEYLATIDRLGDTPEARMRGIYNAAEVTVDFSRHGSLGTTINAWIPYWNPTVQGIDKLIRSVAGDRQGINNALPNALKTVGRAAIVSALPEALLLAVLSALDRRDDWEKLSDRTKDMYYCIPLMDEHRFLKIPKNRTWAAILGTPITRLVQAADGRDDPFESYWDINFKGQLLPEGVEGAFGFSWAYDLAMNKDFAGSEIVSSQYKDYTSGEYADNKYIYDADTSLIAKGLSTLIFNKLSPVQVDYIISDYFGDFYSMFGDLFTVGMITGDSTFGENLQDAGRRVQQSWITDNRYSSQTSGDYYRVMDELGVAIQDAKLQNPDTYKDTLEYKTRQAMTKINKQVSALSKQARDMVDGEEKDGIKLEAIALMDDALEVYRMAMSGEIEEPLLWVEYSPYGAAIRDELIELSEYDRNSGGDYSIAPSFSNATALTDPDKTGYQYKLTDEERELHESYYVDAYMDIMGTLMRSSAYQSASDERRAEMLEEERKKVSPEARSRLAKYLKQHNRKSEPKK